MIRSVLWKSPCREPFVRDTCNLYFKHIKVNFLFYTRLSVPFKDGILLDPLSCTYRFEWSFMDDKECKHKRTSTPSVKEAWKRRQKKHQVENHQTSGATRRWATRSARRLDMPGHLEWTRRLMCAPPIVHLMCTQNPVSGTRSKVSSKCQSSYTYHMSRTRQLGFRPMYLPFTPNTINRRLFLFLGLAKIERKKRA